MSGKVISWIILFYFFITFLSTFNSLWRKLFLSHEMADGSKIFFVSGVYERGWCDRQKYE